MGTIITTMVLFQMQGFLDLGDSFNTCITTTLTLFISSTTPSSVSLFPIPLALSCRTLNILSSLICLVGRAWDRGGEGVGGGDSWNDGAEQVSQVHSLFHRYRAAFKKPEHFACIHPEHLLHM